MKASIYDVAKRSGLSVVTVSRVINNASSVREKNRLKVQQAMKELNYLPNSAARSLALGRTGVIGLILSTLQDSVFEGIVRAVNDQLEDRGYCLALSIDDYRKRRREGGTNYLFQKDRVDGIILLSTMLEAEYVHELREQRIPFVLIDNHLPDAEATMIQVDNFAGGYMAAQHLTQLGHKKIGYLYGPDRMLSARERRQGFEQGLADAGVMPTIAASAGFDIQEGYRVAKEWLGQGIELTAISAADDFMALGVLQAYQEAGFKVPRDISIIGYDDQEFSRKIHPALTTVKQPTVLMATEAVKRLIDLLDRTDGDQNVDEYKGQLVKLQPTLHVRDSTAPPVRN